METYGIEKYGFNPTGRIFRNNPPGALVEKALLNGEGRLSRAGALCIETGKTPRSDGENGFMITKILEQAEDMMLGNKKVELDKVDFLVSRSKR